MSGMPERVVRVVIADDESILRTSLRQLLTAPPSVPNGGRVASAT